MSTTRMLQKIALVISDDAETYRLQIELANGCHVTLTCRKDDPEPRPCVMLWEGERNAAGGLERFREWTLTATGHRPPFSPMRATSPPLYH